MTEDNRVVGDSVNAGPCRIGDDLYNVVSAVVAFVLVGPVVDDVEVDTDTALGWSDEDPVFVGPAVVEVKVDTTLDEADVDTASDETDGDPELPAVCVPLLSLEALLGAALDDCTLLEASGAESEAVCPPFSELSPPTVMRKVRTLSIARVPETSSELGGVTSS